MPYLRLPLLLLVAALCGTSTASASSWCHREQLAPFSAALEMLGESGDVVSAEGLQTLITSAFHRVKCDKLDLGNYTCETCLTAANIYQSLQLAPGSGLDEENFERATTIIVHWSHRLEVLCPIAATLDWDDMDYAYIADWFMHFSPPSTRTQRARREDEHDHDFTLDQLEGLLTTINSTYRPGPNGTVDPPADVCHHENVTSFRAGDIYEISALADPIEGVSEEELGHMNSFILHRILRGDCIMEDTRITEEFPLPEDYIFELFEEFADHETCLIMEEGWDQILHNMAIGEHHDDHDDHDHDHDHFAESRRKRSPSQMDALRRRVTDSMADDDDDHDHDHDHGLVKASTTCLDGDQLLASFGLNITDGLSREDWLLLTPALVQQAAQGCVHNDTTSATWSPPSAAQVWGFGLLSVLIISAFCPLGLLIVRWKHSPYYKYLMVTMLGLAAGSLAGDALLHLIPQGLGLHSHAPGEDHSDHDHDDEDQEHVWKMLVCCLGVWGLFVLQGIIQRSSGHSHGPEKPVMTTVELQSVAYTEQTKSKELESNGHVNGDVNSNSNGNLVGVSQEDVSIGTEGLGWMVCIGDGFHNFADGLAIGASFAYDVSLGISTSIAVLTHEIPHELGDCAALLSTGWSVRRVLSLQLISQSMAILGLCIGIPVASMGDANQWIYILAAGLFIYVALANVIPEILQYFHLYDSLGIFIMANVGIGIGFLAMLLIAIFEDDIAV